MMMHLKSFLLSISSAIVKLNDKFRFVTEALLHLRKYAKQQSIVNVSRLCVVPVGKGTFAENFAMVTRK